MSRKLLAAFLSTLLVLVQTGGFFVINNLNVTAQDAKNALMRGYRTGYSDGYMAGYRDSVEKSQRNYQKHPDFIKADRAYSQNFGALDDYRDGYQQGFAAGYNTGFDRREFNSVLPENLSRQGAKPNTIAENKNEPRLNPGGSKTGNPPVKEDKTAPPQSAEPLIIIPANTELIVEIQSELGTKESRRGDTFQAKVVAPVEIEGAVIEGRVSELQRPGRIKRRAELQLAFDRIVITDKRWANLNAMVVESLPEKGIRNNVKAVDAEGVVQGKSSLKTDVITVGAAAGTGLTVGAIAGGPVGAAVGAAVGGAFGLGGVLVSRGKDIKLPQGQRLRIRTSYETQIR